MSLHCHVFIQKEVTETKTEDIEDPGAYSIEDAKQKAEYDKMMQLAEEKKMRVRSTISDLRDQFEKLIDKNNKLPEHLRLHRKVHCQNLSRFYKCF